MPNKYSCADFTFPLLPHEKVLDLLALLDFTAVDLGIFEGRSHHDPSTLIKDPTGHAQTMKTALEKRGLEAADVFIQTGAEPPVMAANDPDPAVREANRATLRGMIDYTAALGATHLTGLPGDRHEGVDPKTDWDLAVAEARWRLKACAASGITYAIEAHVGSILPDPAATLRFLKAVPGLTLTLDYGHFAYQGIADDEVHPLVPYASHFHARGGAKGILQSTVKDNTIDFPEILRRLKAAGYDGYLCLEYVYVDWEGCNRTDNISETLKLREFLKDEESRVATNR